MRQIFLGFLLSFSLTSPPSSSLAQEYHSPSDQNYNLLASEAVGESFNTTATRLVQQQIYLIARLEQALTEPDPNRMRSVRGQLTIQTKSVEGFLRRQYSSPKTLCTPSADSSINLSPPPVQLTETQAQIYCSLYTSSQELLKLAPGIDRLLSRRGELALVRQLPLVSGERQFDPVLPLAPVQRPDLGKPATPFSTREPDLTSSSLSVVGRDTKTAIANYQPPMQPAIAPLEEMLTTLKAANQLLKVARGAFAKDTQFIDPQETAAILDRFAYDIDPQEPQTYAKFLELSNTGIFRVLPDSAYRRQINTLQNRLQASVSQRYPFPSLGETKGGFTPSLALQVDGDNFHLVHPGVDYGFMVDVGDVPLAKLDGSLEAVPSPTREFFLNYQPPQQLEALQVDQRRFLTGKDQNRPQSQVILAGAKAELNHTYIVRSLQFQLPEIVLNRQLIPQQNSRSRAQLGQLQSSDLILAFRPVRRRSDGSYTVIWRVLQQLPAPTIEDLANYLK